jgi:hypothetical protein
LIEYPADVVRELLNLRQQSEKGVGVLAEAEAKQVQLALAAEREEALAFLDAQGTVADRQAVAKLASIDAREAAELAKVEVNRIKTKLKQLSEAQMAVQTSARMIELQWKTAGVER